MIIAIAISLMVGYFLGAWVTYCQYRKAILNHNQSVQGEVGDGK